MTWSPHFIKLNWIFITKSLFLQKHNCHQCRLFKFTQHFFLTYSMESLAFCFHLLIKETDAKKVVTLHDQMLRRPRARLRALTSRSISFYTWLSCLSYVVSLLLQLALANLPEEVQGGTKQELWGSAKVGLMHIYPSCLPNHEVLLPPWIFYSILIQAQK